MRRTAVVTGATGDLGYAIAERLLQDGLRVVLHARDEMKANAALARLRETVNVDTDAIKYVIGNIDDSAGRAAFATEVAHEGIQVDVLVNCAGGGGAHETWWETSDDKWEACFRLNVMGTVGLCKVFVPGMQQRGWGRVINVASVAGTRPLAIGPEYAAAKAAVRSLTVSLAQACANSGVTVNAVSPGLCMTNKVRGFLEPHLKTSASPDESLDAFASREVFPNLVGELARPEDVGELVSLLASDRGGRITGQDLVVDGGYLSITPC
ncbi:SDR family NAD(P)-dependent oxidoreductase [Burkholderia ubonensis]|uniref:SDR family NAD(P)-dependent oxidoreductase n=1 Tax=Burkholderia ubonensis TaxID=101571 RepID=UPI0009B334ED|nr:SDR family oxidoreductase [Burkholderia ubonensis]